MNVDTTCGIYKSIYDVFPMEPEHKTVVERLRKIIPLDDDQEVALCEIIRRYLDPETGNLHNVQLLPADTGWGKTRVSIYVSCILNVCFGMRPMIICPANLRIQWKACLDEASVKAIGIYSYNEIRGQKGGSATKKDPDGIKIKYTKPPRCKHPYLIRGDGEHGPFEATEEWNYEINKGTFLIIDESQNLKNDSGQHYAVIELIHTLCNAGAKLSRILHLTASFVDKPDSLRCLMRCFGYTKRNDMLKHNPGKGVVEWRKYGLGEVVQVAEMIDQRATANALMSVNRDISAKNLPDIFLNLWVNVFRQHVVIPVKDAVYCHPVTGIPFARNRINGFYELDEASKAKAFEAIQGLKRANIIRDDGFVNMRAANMNFGAVQKSLMLLCESKLITLVRVALEYLRTTNSKLVLCIPFIKGQESVFKLLNLYGPLVLNGQVDMDSRPNIIAKFNEPNDKCRVIIMTPQVGGVGINLNDTDGRFPRVFLGTPTFHFLDWFQASGRTYRRGMMSDTTIIMIYAANAPLESVLVNTMTKSAICRDVIVPGSGRKFPGDFDIIIENEKKYKGLRAGLIQMKNMNA